MCLSTIQIHPLSSLPMTTLTSSKIRLRRQSQQKCLQRKQECEEQQPRSLRNVPEEVNICIKNQSTNEALELLVDECYTHNREGYCVNDLNLVRNGLSNLPHQIESLHCLSFLNLSRNLFHEVPHILFSLTNLTTLNMSDNILTTLPHSIGKLTKLKTLRLSDNQLTSLPEELGSCVALESLHLGSSYGGNNLTCLPLSITKLLNLAELICNRNELTSLPEDIGQLTSLKQLSCENNRLQSLPESIGVITNLVKLNVSHNQISQLPESLKFCVNLRVLNIRNNLIDSLPGALCWSSNTILLGGNPLSSIADSAFGVVPQIDGVCGRREHDDVVSNQSNVDPPIVRSDHNIASSSSSMSIGDDNHNDGVIIVDNTRSVEDYKYIDHYCDGIKCNENTVRNDDSFIKVSDLNSDSNSEVQVLSDSSSAGNVYDADRDSTIDDSNSDDNNTESSINSNDNENDSKGKEDKDTYLNSSPYPSSVNDSTVSEKDFIDSRVDSPNEQLISDILDGSQKLPPLPKRFSLISSPPVHERHQNRYELNQLNGSSSSEDQNRTRNGNSYEYSTQGTRPRRRNSRAYIALTPQRVHVPTLRELAGSVVLSSIAVIAGEKQDPNTVKNIVNALKLVPKSTKTSFPHDLSSFLESAKGCTGCNSPSFSLSRHVHKNNISGHANIRLVHQLCAFCMCKTEDPKLDW
eukprot:Awhi_evm1s14920